jgi:hypothetical protein
MVLIGALAALAVAAGCSDPCRRLAERTCDDLGPGTICNQARLRSVQKNPNQELCSRELSQWPRILKRLQAAQAAQNQLLRIAPGALKPKILSPDAGLEQGGHHDDDGHNHGGPHRINLRPPPRYPPIAPGGPAGDGGAPAAPPAADATP